jgi:hypothetical protein
MNNIGETLNGALQSFLDTTANHLPGILGAIVVLIIGWLIAKALRGLTKSALRKTDLDNRLFKSAKSNFSPEDMISKIVYYVIMLIVLMVVLEKLGVKDVLDPVKGMVGTFLAAVPKIITAGIIGFAGYMIATIVSELMGFAGDSLDRLSTKMGLASNDFDLGKLVKQIVFLIIFIPILILAIDKLEFNAISDPLKGMLTTMVEAIPKLVVAAILLAVFYFGGKFVTNILRELLANLGVDNMANKMGIANIVGNTKMSSLAANLVFAFLMFTGIIQVCEQLEFGQITVLLNDLLEISGRIFFGLVIMAIGNWISTIASNAVTDNFLKTVTRMATLGLFLAIALRTMGIANDIVNLAFGLTLGAVAVAVALSFGLGGREAAGKQMEHILKKFRGE